MTKKVLSLLLIVFVLISCFALVTISASAKAYSPVLASDASIVASGEAGDDIVWSLDSNGLLTFSGTGFMNIEEIDLPWLLYSDSIKNVVVGEGIETVVEGAFSFCENLETVEIASTVLNIGADAFFMCPMDLTIKGYTGSVSEWTAGAFGYTFISLGDAPNEEYAVGVFGDTYNLSWSLNTLGELYITGIGSMGYVGYQDSPWEEYKLFIRHVIIGMGVTDINEHCFNECDILIDVQIPSTVTHIPNWAFDGSYMMSTIKGYDNTAAQEYADYQGYEFISLGEPAVGEIAGGKITDTINWSFDTEGLLAITGSGKIPNYNSSDNPVPWSTFSNSVKSVVVADGITAIGNYNFYNCDLLTSVTLPDTLTSIGSYAFCSCDSLTEILLHYNVTTIGNGALSTYAQSFVLKGYKYSYAEEYANNNFVDFESVGNAPCITVAEGSCGANVKWTYDNYKTLTLSGSGKTVDLESYSSSQPDWQQYRSYIKKVVVGKGIENIGNYLFKGTSSLAEVEIADSVTSIGTSAFFNCSNLKTVTIPASVTTIASSAFSQCPSDMVIKGYIPSVAYDFATSKSYTFTSLGNLPETEIASGDCGDNVKWSLSNYGKLTISGKGTMEFEDNSSGGNAGEDSGGSIGGIVVGGDSYAGVLSIDYNDVPWYSYASKIKSVVK